jgi:hypothetical protein
MKAMILKEQGGVKNFALVSVSIPVDLIRKVPQEYSQFQ